LDLTQDDARNAGALPDGWVWTTLGEIADTTRKREKPQEHPGLRFIGMEHVEAHTMHLLDTVPASQMKSMAEFFEPGDVLYGRLRPYLNKVYSPDFAGLCSAEFIVFRHVPWLDHRYLQYFLNSLAFVSFASRLNEGDRPRVNFSQLAPYPLPLPPSPEQHRIVAEIETQFTRLEAGVAGLKRAQANLRRHKAAVLKAACEGRLVPTEAELASAESRDYEPADALLQRILAERRAKWQVENPGKRYQAPAPPDTSDLPELPEGWAWATVEQLASPEPRSVQSGPFGSALLHSEFQDAGILAIGIDNVLEGQFSMGKQHRISPEKFEQLRRFAARPLDFLITVMATVGRCCVVPPGLETAIITKHVYRISTDKSIIDPHYLMYAFWGGSEVRRQLLGEVRGQTRPGINGTILKQIAVPVPVLAEQQRIIAEVERRLSVVGELEKQVEAALRRAERLRQAILKRAFEGRLVPQDPADEPASALLERIQAEQAWSQERRARGTPRQSHLPGL
jgi:type I restriction enzyme S subunit